MHINLAGLSSNVVTVIIAVEDANDNGPALEVFDSEVTISDSEIKSPFLFAVSSLISNTKVKLLGKRCRQRKAPRKFRGSFK
jgi:hypothetical protein